MNTSRMPALFLGHGSPMNVLEDNRYTRAWRALGESLPRPKAIVAISAHWYTRGTAVTSMENPKPFTTSEGSRRRCSIPVIRRRALPRWLRSCSKCWRRCR